MPAAPEVSRLPPLGGQATEMVGVGWGGVVGLHARTHTRMSWDGENWWKYWEYGEGW